MANNRIKGITIEIGGDTTKLDKALDATNKELKTTQTSLKDVDRLLKLDPSNIELLDQKQRLLAKSTDLTSEKLKTLKQAAEESTASNVKYEQWQKAFTSLQAQITKTSNEITSLEKEGKKLEDLGFAPDSAPLQDVQNQLEAARAKMEQLEKKTTDTFEELGRPISIDQWDALQREIADTEIRFRDLDKAAGDAADGAGSLGNSLSGIGPSLSDVSDKAGSVSSALAPVSKAIVGIGAAAIAAVPATEEFRVAMGKLNTAYEASGFSAETAQEAYRGFYEILGDTDTATEASQLLAQLANSEEDVSKWTEIAAGIYGTFGDSIPIEGLVEAVNETAKVGQVTGVLADALNWVGISEDEFNEILKTTATEGDRAALIMNNLGMVYGDAADMFYKNNEALIESRDATIEFQRSMANLAEEVQPFLTTLTDMASTFMDWFTGLPDGAKAAVVGIAAFVAVISPIAGIISAITGALSAAGIASTVFSVAGTSVTFTLGQWVLIIGVVIAAVLALAAAIAYLTGKSKEMEMPEVPDYSSAVPSGNGRTRSRSMSAVTAQDLPYLAQGTVTRPNSPFMAVVGDNPNEPEVVSPLSTIEQAVRNVVGSSGGQINDIRVTVNFTGSLAQVARLMQPQITVETNRLGPQLAK